MDAIYLKLYTKIFGTWRGHFPLFLLRGLEAGYFPVLLLDWDFLWVTVTITRSEENRLSAKWIWQPVNILYYHSYVLCHISNTNHQSMYSPWGYNWPGCHSSQIKYSLKKAVNVQHAHLEKWATLYILPFTFFVNDVDGATIFHFVVFCQWPGRGDFDTDNSDLILSNRKSEKVRMQDWLDHLGISCPLPINAKKLLNYLQITRNIIL